MNQESMMVKAARIYLMKIGHMVELDDDDASETDRPQLAQAFGMFWARLIRLAESMDAAPDERRERNGMKVALEGTPEEIARFLGNNDRQWIPVGSRTPETAEPVIICRKSGGNFITGVGTYRDGVWRVFDSSAKKVEFWCPLPPPPLTMPRE